MLVYNLFHGSEIRDVDLAFVDPVVVRLDISVDVASWVHLSQSFQHFGANICYDEVDILAFAISLINMLLYGLLKELDDKVSSFVFHAMIIVIGETGQLSTDVRKLVFL